MKRFNITKYELGDEMIPLDKELVDQVIDNDPELSWYEDVDDYYRNRQAQRENPAVRISFVFNYNPPPSNPDFHATYFENTKYITVKIHKASADAISKLEEIAKKLEANLVQL